jgi:hypothetical protein
MLGYERLLEMLIDFRNIHLSRDLLATNQHHTASLKNKSRPKRAAFVHGYFL